MNQLSGKHAFCNATHSSHRTRMALGLCMCLSVLTLSACSSIRDGSLTTHSAATAGNTLSARDQAMFDDLVGIVTQVFEPLNTTLQINRDNRDPHMQYFVDSLAAEGFGIQRVSADQGAHYLSYTLKPTDQPDETHLSVAVGAVLIGRDYRIAGNRAITPASVVRLSGTRREVAVEDNASRHFMVEDPSLSDAQYVASLGLDEASPVLSLITPEVVSRVSEQASGGPSLHGLNSSKVEINNLFYGDESTFASVLENYRQVDRQVIIFGNDSMVLGDTNKQLIEQFVDTRMRDADVISLVGCSNGPTALAIGNEGLALGRAQRVTQALMARGVARDQVLDEGCWAPTNVGDRFPSRGVVMELWRSNT